MTCDISWALGTPWPTFAFSANVDLDLCAAQPKFTAEFDMTSPVPLQKKLDLWDNVSAVTCFNP